MLACLCPNGLNRYDGARPPRLLLVATASGISVLERDAPGGVEVEARLDLVDVQRPPLVGEQAEDDLPAKRGRGRRRGEHFSSR